MKLLSIFTFKIAGIINVFVPSGGGQWAVQGPIIIEAATQIGVSIPKSVMALAYGDQFIQICYSLFGHYHYWELQD